MYELQRTHGRNFDTRNHEPFFLLFYACQTLTVYVCVCVYTCVCVWIYKQISGLNFHRDHFIFKTFHMAQIWVISKISKSELIFLNVYWAVHHCDSWRIRDQLDVTSYYVLFHFFYAQHISDINIFIIRSLRLFYCINTFVVCSCFDVCWSFGVVGLCFPCYTDTIPIQP